MAENDPEGLRQSLLTIQARRRAGPTGRFKGHWFALRGKITNWVVSTK